MARDPLTAEQYAAQQAACDNLCTVPVPAALEPVDAGAPTLLRCVTCPFCKVLVDAILTPASISCPACQVTVPR